MSKKPNSKARLKKEQWTVYLDKAEADALRALSDKTRVPMAEYIREGLLMVLAKYHKKGARQ